MSTAEPTLEQLQLAYRQLSRPGWPSFERCLTDHVRRTCLTAIARNLGRAGWRGTQQATSLPRGPAVPPTPLVPPPTARPRRGPSPIDAVTAWTRPRGVDLKRAAANDKDD